jgi:hypothetical protein
VEPHAGTELLSRIHTACQERSVPRFVPTPDDNVDRLSCVETLRCLWAVDQIIDIPYDALRIHDALIWLSKEEFRFAFLRLMAVGVGMGNAAAIHAVVQTAAVPVPKGSCQPPLGFAAFSPSDIQLVSDVICRFVGEADEENLWASTRRIYFRAQRNWKRFSEG